MATATPATGITHLEIPDFVALTERGNWGACGIIAELDALQVCPWGNISFADPAAIDAKAKQWIAEYAAAGRASATGITTLGNIHWHLQLHAPHLAGYIPWSATPNLDALHTFVKTHMLLQNPVIIEVGNAAALPNNQTGIQFHFVVLGGIDSTLGYLVANGDTQEALTTTHELVQTHWATWQQLITAKVCGAIAVQRGWTPPPPPDTPLTPLQVLDDALATLGHLRTLLEGH